MSENVLTIENATMQFGGVVAVDNLNLKWIKIRLSPSSAPTVPAY